MIRTLLPIWLSLLILMLSACELLAPVAAVQPATSTPGPTPSILPPTPTITPQPTEAGPVTLNIWWPDDLVPGPDAEGVSLLETLTGDFMASRSDGIRVENRIRRSEGFGSVIQTILSATSVAPGALPDLALLRWRDLVLAVQSGLVQPIPAESVRRLTGDVFPAALDLARINGRVMGLPYVLVTEHIAYRPVSLVGSFSSFDSVLTERQRFVFPAGGAETPNHVLLVQYLSAGGSLTDLNRGVVRATALRRLLDFYDQAFNQKLVDGSVLDYARPEDYQDALTNNQLDAAVITSRMYLDLVSRGHALNAAPVPMWQGEPRSVLDGWLWVVVTRDPNRQTESLRFVEWMLDPARETSYASAVNGLPPRRAALELWPDEAYAAFTARLLTNAVVPNIEAPAIPAMRAIQASLAAVLTRQRTPAEAVQDVLAQLGN